MNPRIRTAAQASAVCIGANALMTALKLAAGLLARSDAVLSDAADSAADVLSAVIILIGVKMAQQSADPEHPYGHERFQSVASILLSGLMCATGIGVGRSALTKLIANDYGAPVGALALAASLVSVAGKLLLSRFSAKAGERFAASALTDNARNYRMDALSSAGAFAGVLGSMLGLRFLDPLAGLAICVAVLRTAVEIFAGAIDGLVDKSCDEPTENRIRTAVSTVPGVVSVDRLLTRRFGERIYVELEIAADAALPLSESHAISEQVHDTVERAFPQTKHCSVHVNPAPELLPNGDEDERDA